MSLQGRAKRCVLGRLCQKASLEKCVLRREPQKRSPAAVSMQLKWLAACMHTSDIYFTINTGSCMERHPHFYILLTQGAAGEANGSGAAAAQVAG